MNLELKHLAPYLPYNVNFCESDEIEHTVKKLTLKKAKEIIKNPLVTTVLILRPLPLIVDPENIDDLPYKQVQTFLNLHYDVFGLIEKGLAINIHTLNQTP